MRVFRYLAIALAASLAVAPPVPADGHGGTDRVELVMVDQPGCVYCARWEAEIGPIYPKTPEGAFAPLRRVDLRAPVPDGLSFASKPVVTPTFILVRGGRELARVEGYPGDEMFWWMLARLLEDNTDYEGGSR